MANPSDKPVPASRTIVRLDRKLERARQVLERWREMFEGDPAHAFEWADAALEAAAVQKVVRNARTLLISGTSAPEIIEHERRLARSEAAHPTRSTSAIANELCRAVLSARVELIEELEQEQADGEPEAGR